MVVHQSLQLRLFSAILWMMFCSMAKYDWVAEESALKITISQHHAILAQEPFPSR